MLSTGRSEAISAHPDLPLPVAFRPHPRARGDALRLDETRALLLLTCPPRSSRRAALDWAGGQRDWVEAQLARCNRPNRSCLAPSSRSRAATIRLDWHGGRRRPSLANDILSCGGPVEAFARRVETLLRAARAHLLSPTRRLRAPRQRSASSGSHRRRRDPLGQLLGRGRIRYNWRLVLAPPEVARWVVAHEVAHRRHMNHGPAFKALEAELFDGDVAAARALLLRRSGRGSSGSAGSSDGGGGGRRDACWLRHRLEWMAASSGLRRSTSSSHCWSTGASAARSTGASGSPGLRARIAIFVDQWLRLRHSSGPSPPRRAPAASRASALRSRTARPAGWRRRRP